MAEKIEAIGYRDYRTCAKCGYAHLTQNPKIEYKSAEDLLARTCRRCGYQWWESPINHEE